MSRDDWIHHVGSRALTLRSLGKVSANSAYEIGVESLAIDRRDREDVARVLLELRPVEAVQDLCRIARDSNDKVVCCSIARSLRSVENEALLQDAVVDLLNSNKREARRSGAFIAGFLSTNVASSKLCLIAYTDPCWEVCSVAQTAIRTRQREREAIKLIHSLSILTEAEVWGTIDCILRLVDPGIAAAPSDPIGFLKALREKPFVIRKHFWNQLEKRKKKVEDEMKSLHGKWNPEL